MDALAERALAWSLRERHASFSFALVRVIYGLIMLMVLTTNFADRAYLWGFASRWVDPGVESRDVPLLFSVLFPKDNPVLFDLCYWALILLAVVFVAGWKTRWVTPLLLVFWESLSSNSTVLNNSGDTVMRITLVFLVFADLSKHWSIDALSRSRRPVVAHPRAWIGILVHNTALVLCVVQLIVIYVTSSYYKFTDQAWLDGTAAYYPLTIDGYSPFPQLNELAWQWDIAVYGVTWVTLFAQALFPLCLLWRPSRIAILVIVGGMHVAIAVLTGLWAFSLVMVALDLLVIRDRTWVAATGWLQSRLRRPQRS